MEIIHLKYVAEIAKTGSITQAASNLCMNQPNLSKAIKSLENELGFAIFKRSSKGVFLTKEGGEFLISAKEILKKFEDLESRHRGDGEARRSFGVSVPRASYIACAFARFVSEVSNSTSFQFDFCETNSIQAVRNVSSQKHNFGIVRFALEHEKYYNKLLHDLNLEGEILLDFEYLAVMSASNPLARKDQLSCADLTHMIEITNGDSFIPAFLTEEIHKQLFGQPNARTISVYERGSQFDLLSMVPSVYMWVSPIPDELLARHGLVQKKVEMDANRYRDVLIRSKAYRFTATEHIFLKHLYRHRDLAKI